VPPTAQYPRYTPGHGDEAARTLDAAALVRAVHRARPSRSLILFLAAGYEIMNLWPDRLRDLLALYPVEHQR
jgi:hypothetical protein